MTNRPNLIDLRANASTSALSTTSRPLRSPRIHVAGEAPPELSPLDAFALQSRILARQLQESTREGNRISRLPPLTLESPLVIQGRSDYFRSMSQECPSDNESNPASDGLGLRTEVEDAFEPSQRPQSMHPRMSRIPPLMEDDIPALPQNFPAMPQYNRVDEQSEKKGFFDTQRVRSPSPVQSDTQSFVERRSEKSPSRMGSSSQLVSPIQSSSTSITGVKQRSFDDVGLVPPRALFPKRSTNTLSSSPPVFSDDDALSHSAVTSHPLLASSRKLSSGSTAFAAPGILSSAGSFHRSPSVASDSSGLPRPSFNFSRPLSRSGTPSFDMPTRQASSDSHPSFVLADDSVHTPVSMHSEAFLDQQAEDGKGSPYVYSKFSLPRGKAVERSEETQSYGDTLWEPPVMPQSSSQKLPLGAPPSPPTRPSSSLARVVPDDPAHSLPRPSVDVAKASLDISRIGTPGYPSPNPSRPSDETGRQSEDGSRGRTMQSHLQDALRDKTPASASTSDSASTIRPPPTARTNPIPSSDMTTEEHLAMGIKCHEEGSLNKSTYHLRLAARQNNPTAMLLYALACRHGWGMRPNQKEGVEWLRKAVEYVSIELADDEDQAKEGKQVDFAENKTRKAQFALSTYELGVSHMNGWGIEQDKVLALRCFEIAGNWGDVDALAEAGFCYAKGVGCKKNLKKSARYYRLAEAKGMSMVGNSWIHKSKYNDDGKIDLQKSDTKKNRSKSRTRNMFGFKSSS